jgi:hypothetical protein
LMPYCLSFFSCSTWPVCLFICLSIYFFSLCLIPCLPIIFLLFHMTCLSVHLSFHLLFSVCLFPYLMPSFLWVFSCSRWPDKPGGGADQPQHQLPCHVRSGYTQNIALFAFLKNVGKN